MKTELPLAASPIIGMQHLAYPLNILLNYKECLPWFHSDYVQIQYDEALSTFTFYKKDFFDIPWLSWQLLKKNTFYCCGKDLSDFVVEFLRNGWYFCSSFDEYFVPDRKSFKKEHFIHDFMIYGCDTDGRQFQILGFDQHGDFTTTIISFEELPRAVFFENTLGLEWVNNMCFFSKKRNYKFEFDKELLQQYLGDYLVGKNTWERVRCLGNPLSGHRFGINIYPLLREYFAKLATDCIEYDIRPLHLLYEHKKCMVIRLEYIASSIFSEFDKNILEDFRQLEMQSLKLRNIQMKYELTGKRALLGQIEDELGMLEKTDYNATSRFLEKLILSQSDPTLKGEVLNHA